MRKMFRQLVISVIISVFRLVSSYETLNCSPVNIPIDVGPDKHVVVIKSPEVNFTYNRDSLATYLYPGTPSVNLFINESWISVKIVGDVNDHDSKFIKHEKQYVTEITGFANIDNVTDYNTSLQDCHFFVSDKLTGSFYNELSTKLDAMIYYVIERCLTKKMCESLGAIRYNDTIRAKASPRDFGPMSIWSKNLQASFPNVVAPKLADNNEPKKRANLIEAADSIVRRVSDGFRVASEGIVKIPDTKHVLHIASKGTFSGLHSLVRAENYLVKVSRPTQNPQLFTFTFGIPEGQVVYEDHHAFDLIPVHGRLCADVNDVLFSATVAMDFSRQYCRASLTNFTLTSKGTSETYACGSLSFITNSIMQWFVNIWDSEIVVAIKNEIQWTMSNYVRDKFDCENFRPESKNHV